MQACANSYDNHALSSSLCSVRGSLINKSRREVKIQEEAPTLMHAQEKYAFGSSGMSWCSFPMQLSLSERASNKNRASHEILIMTDLSSSYYTRGLHQPKLLLLFFAQVRRPPCDCCRAGPAYACALRDARGVLAVTPLILVNRALLCDLWTSESNCC